MALRTGIRCLDEALGREGFPRGRVIEIFGAESCGKTTLALQVAAQTQAAGGTVLYIDADHSYEPSYAQRLGVATETLLLSRPQNGDEGLQLALSLLRTFALDLIVIDTVAALSPEQETVDASAAGALHAELMTRSLRKLFWFAARAGTTVILLNHGGAKWPALRSEGEFTQGEFTQGDFTTGGHSVTLYSSLRLRLSIVAEDTVGARIRVRVVKNRLWESWPEVDLYMRYGEGFVEEAGTPRKPARSETQTTGSVLGRKAHSARG